MTATKLPKPILRLSGNSTSVALPLSLAASLSLALGGCNGAFLGNFFVLGVTIAIFFGTLSLGRKSEGSRADASAADGSRSARPMPRASARPNPRNDA